MSSPFQGPLPTYIVSPLAVPFLGSHRNQSSLSRHPTNHVFRVCRNRHAATFGFKSYNWSCCQSDKVNTFVEVQQLLDKTPIYLIGMMGSGKSTVGQYLATKLNYSFLDTDQLIESVQQKKISEIFEQYGENKFREWESAILSKIQPCLGYVIATGGGIVLKDSNWSHLRNGIVVFLDVSISTIMKRLLNDTTRPLLQGADPQKRLEEIRSKRLPLYLRADIHIQLNDFRMEQEFTEEQWTALITQRLMEFLTTTTTTKRS